MAEETEEAVKHKKKLFKERAGVFTSMSKKGRLRKKKIHIQWCTGCTMEVILEHNDVLE